MKNWFRGKKQIPLLSPLEGYNLWASSYKEESNPIKDLSDTLVEKILPDLSGKIFLDAGCGAGKFCAYAIAHGAAAVHGSDLSPSMIAIAKQQCPEGNFQSGDLAATAPAKDSFDVVLSALVLAHIEELHPSLDNLLSALKPEGTIIITDFHPFLTLQQAKRTFRDVASGKTFEVRHHLHLFSEYLAIFKTHNVTVDLLEEPVYNGVPVVFGMRGIKEAR